MTTTLIVLLPLILLEEKRGIFVPLQSIQRFYKIRLLLINFLHRIGKELTH
jgi:hypothetical protein